MFYGILPTSHRRWPNHFVFTDIHGYSYDVGPTIDFSVDGANQF